MKLFNKLASLAVAHNSGSPFNPTTFRVRTQDVEALRDVTCAICEALKKVVALPKIYDKRQVEYACEVVRNWDGRFLSATVEGSIGIIGNLAQKFDI